MAHGPRGDGEPLVWTSYEAVPEWITGMGTGAMFEVAWAGKRTAQPPPMPLSGRSAGSSCMQSDYRIFSIHCSARRRGTPVSRYHLRYLQDLHCDRS